MTAPDTGPVTEFWDMSSGGTQKTDFKKIYVELPQPTAVQWFRETFGQSPHRVACSCCGPNFSVTSSENLREATAYERGCDWDEEAEEWLERPSDRQYAAAHRSLHEFLQVASRDLEDTDPRYLVLLEPDLDSEAVGVA